MAPKIVADEKKKSSSKKKNDAAKNNNKIWSEARKEIIPLSVGAIALVASSSVNQAVPRLMGVLMDPSKSSTSSASNTTCSNNTTERQFVIQILWLSIAGGTASFIRVSFHVSIFCFSCILYSPVLLLLLLLLHIETKKFSSFNLPIYYHLFSAKNHPKFITRNT
jgi:hypothetical protein